ncbi:MAG: tRNA pseudouridine(38-40) synthase TruA [Lachnospiraceae bacterium]|nr:tRNA pseudouridine(38-40) synthase TruA [Lachnospiraceae bacterium]
MKRVMLTIAYDGTNYCGWQTQKNGLAVEEVINNTLSEMLGEDICVIGASRTDAGVHAMGNVAVFDTDSRIPADKFSYALNQRLPDDIVVQSSCQVDAGFHPRHCNSTKTYEYKILNRRFPLPTERLYSHFLYYDLNIKKMQDAADYLVGTHDFKSFCSVNTQVKDTIRTIFSINVEKSDETVKIRVSGNGFLYNMVRIISGTLIQAGTGQINPEDVKIMLEAKDRNAAGPTAPARGLTLVGIKYQNNC